MGLEKVKRDIEDAVRVLLGSALGTWWRITPGHLGSGENVSFLVPHERCIRSCEAVRALEDAIARITSRVNGEKWDVVVNHEPTYTRVAIRRSKLAKAFDFQSGYSIPPRCGKVRNAAEAWRESAMARLAELNGTTEASAPNTFFAKGINMDEPRLIIRDELADWTKEQRQKKTEGRIMFEVNEIVAITEENKVIRLVVHKEESEKVLHMTAQVAAKYQHAEVRKVDVVDGALVLHVGWVKE